jgi:hypothetical protein
MSIISNNILEQLNDDIISHGWLVQCIEQNIDTDEESPLGWKEVLKQLLMLGEVEIGEAKIASPDYVEFIAWKGTVEERIARAIKEVDTASDFDRSFADWICLRENIDRFE